MRIRTQTGLLSLMALVASGSFGCNSFDEPINDDDTGPELRIPIDERPVQSAPVMPLPVSGGTLSTAVEGKYAVAADPERDRVSIINLDEVRLVHTIQLEQGAEPGRSVESADGLVHVALRGSGEVITIDVVNGAVRQRQTVCKSPRGLAFEQATQRLHVACVEGRLVSLNAFDLGVTRTISLDADLRDVMVRGSELWVTRFKSAEVIRIDAKGEVGSRIVQPERFGSLTQPVPKEEQDQFGPVQFKEVSLQAGVAWRTVPTQGGGAVMVHQQAVIDEIEIPEPSPQGGSAYGGGGDFGFDCSNGIVKNTVSTIAADGTSVATNFMGPPMPVDVALSPDHAWVAVAHAGPADMEAPRPEVVFREDNSEFVTPTAIQMQSAVSMFPTGIEGCAFSEGAMFDAPVVAVTFSPKGPLVVQMREPDQIGVVQEPPWGLLQTISLGGETRKDTGHDLFHRDSGGGIACGSCHPEASEDGHVWSFADVGLRRTQALHVGLRDTAPFHWAGDLPNVGALMSEVFVGRMGGVNQSPQRLSALSEWIFSLESPPPIRDEADEAALRGKVLFESPSVGCTACHVGEKLTNNETVAITTVLADKLQVPSLIGIGYRAPFMHDGCASTLMARFNTACGGDAHGNTSDLTPEQLGDLVAYLESL